MWARIRKRLLGGDQHSSIQAMHVVSNSPWANQWSPLEHTQNSIAFTNWYVVEIHQFRIIENTPYTHVRRTHFEIKCGDMGNLKSGFQPRHRDVEDVVVVHHGSAFKLSGEVNQYPPQASVVGLHVPTLPPECYIFGLPVIELTLQFLSG